ncbi:U-box domain-containing protein 28-like [Juglans regia]|uniref:U-box domain-containing protein n=2 Tax=Juglans regia TaxID=51240 RepID=A0A2I4DJ97_JUGRE|nr:U-box domain-containing protein 28-like [Juglans regia]
MGREELSISVPSPFRCPISMEVMKSPVSLCTGVTYDRSSIQHWLESGHDTCPATMQVLPSKHLVPNLTLHRLIHLWLLHHHHSSLNSPSSSSSSTAALISSEQVRIFVDMIEGDNGGQLDCHDYLAKIVDFAKVRDENRRFLAHSKSFVEVIVSFLCKSREIEVLELVVRVLYLIMSQKGVEERVRGLIFGSNNQKYFSSICLLLRDGSLSSKIESVRILESLASDSESKRGIAEKEDLVSVLFHLLNSDNANTADLHDAILSCLIAVSGSRFGKSKLIRLGLVRVLSERLSNPNTKTSTAEKSLNLLSVAASCGEGRSTISEDSKQCVAAVVERLMKAGTEDAVAVLWGMCCLHGDRKVKDVVVKSNGVTKLLLVMQSEYCEGHVRRMCAELLKVLRDGFKSAASGGLGLGRYETKTTHIMPC